MSVEQAFAEFSQLPPELQQKVVNNVVQMLQGNSQRPVDVNRARQELSNNYGFAQRMMANAGIKMAPGSSVDDAGNSSNSAIDNSILSSLVGRGESQPAAQETNNVPVPKPRPKNIGASEVQRPSNSSEGGREARAQSTKNEASVASSGASSAQDGGQSSLPLMAAGGAGAAGLAAYQMYKAWKARNGKTDAGSNVMTEKGDVPDGGKSIPALTDQRPRDVIDATMIEGPPKYAQLEGPAPRLALAAPQEALALPAPRLMLPEPAAAPEAPRATGEVIAAGRTMRDPMTELEYARAAQPMSEGDMISLDELMRNENAKPVDDSGLERTLRKPESPKKAKTGMRKARIR